MPHAKPLDKANVPPYFDGPMGRVWLEDVYREVMETCPSSISLEEQGVDPSLVDDLIDKRTGEAWNRRVQILSGQGLPTLVAMEKRLKALRSEVREDPQWDLEGQPALFQTKRRLACHRHVITTSIIDLYAIYGAVLRWEELKKFIGRGE